MRRRVVVTGLGCISPVGNTVAESWSNLLAGNSGIDLVTSFDTSALAAAFPFTSPDLPPADPASVAAASGVLYGFNIGSQGLVHWNRFDAAYRSRYPAGWYTYSYGGFPYYWYPALPAGAVAVPYGTMTGYTVNGVYFVPYFYNGQVVYIAVPPP